MPGPLTQVTQYPSQASEIPTYAAMTDQQLSMLPHGTLQALRQLVERTGYNANNQSLKSLDVRLAPFEDQAWAREETTAEPIRGALASGIVMPAYQIAKMLGQGISSALNQNNDLSTPADINQIGATYLGVGQGWRNAWRNWTKQPPAVGIGTAKTATANPASEVVSPYP